MSDTVIKVENLSKRYVIGHQAQNSNVTLRDAIANGARSLTQKIFHPHQKLEDPAHEEFWALKDVSFEIKQGDRVGIIGRNGAGKSTLLKILSRITEPTSGKISIKGRVSSLLEVGTGFHPELTGRENIYLNGAILGMGKAEIKKNFDAIVDFAEVEKFIDTPVKHYSSGMYVRLAFAVAAHLEPEILIIDEVLAVGDAAFQKKCLGKMEDVSVDEGKTIVVVSHNMQTLLSLCPRAILLRTGQIESVDSCHNVVKEYLDRNCSLYSFKEWKHDNYPGDDVVRLYSLQVINQQGCNVETLKINEPIGIKMTYEVLKEGQIIWQGYNFHNSEGINIFDSHNVSTRWYKEIHPVGKFHSIAWIPANLLAEGLIIVNCAMFNHSVYKVHFHEKECISFEVIDTLESNSARGDSVGAFPGIVRPLLEWQTKSL